MARLWRENSPARPEIPLFSSRNKLAASVRRPPDTAFAELIHTASLKSFQYSYKVSGGLVGPADSDTSHTYVTKDNVGQYLGKTRFGGSSGDA